VVGFGQEDHFMQTTSLISGSNSSSCNRFPAPGDNTCTSNAFIWLHGDFAEDINHTWAAMVGPGVLHVGVDSDTWADHADIRPTIMTLVCLKDNYTYEGRALLEDLDRSTLQSTVAQRRSELIQLGQLYKRINAPVNDFGKNIISLNTLAIRGDDATYTRLESLLTDVTAERDGLAAQMQSVLGQVPGCGGVTPAPNHGMNGHAESLLAHLRNSLDREQRGSK